MRSQRLSGGLATISCLLAKVTGEFLKAAVHSVRLNRTDFMTRFHRPKNCKKWSHLYWRVSIFCLILSWNSCPDILCYQSSACVTRPLPHLLQQNSNTTIGRHQWRLSLNSPLLHSRPHQWRRNLRPRHLRPHSAAKRRFFMPSESRVNLKMHQKTVNVSYLSTQI